jgi:hypothetical protein
MRALGIAIVRGLVKGLVMGLALGLVLTFVARWPMPVGSLLGYLAAMAACGTTGVAGGQAPWKEGAWLPAALKALAGVAVGALGYWILCAHLDAALPELLASVLVVGASDAAQASWVAAPALSLTAIAAGFGLLVELDHVGGDESPSAKAKSAARGEAAPVARAEPAATQRERRARPTVARTEIENAETVPDSTPPPSQTRRERRSDTR